MATAISELPRFVLDYIAATPSRGNGLNIWLFKVARLLHAFRQDEEIVELLRAATYGEPVQAGEIERAVARSKECAWQPGEQSSYIGSSWPEIDWPRRRHIIKKSDGAVDLIKQSPVYSDDGMSHTEEVIDQLFPGNPLLCVGQSHSKFGTDTRERLRGHLSEMALIVPSPMTARTGRTRDGKLSMHTLQSTGPRQYLVIEQDRGSVNEQAAVLLHLAEYAPFTLAVHSGGKSIHGWFACRDASEKIIREFFEYAVSLGADPQLWTRSQFTRMPDGLREAGNRQAIYYFDPAQLA
jgi:hypothetical protein